MRHIKKSDLRARVKEAWIQAAAEGLKELKTKTTHKNRSEFIAKFFRDNAALWTDLKQCMAQPVPAKCWYSEVQRAVPDLEIDHFRPKNAVNGCEHDGYWWLAFEWGNFRISSPMANKRRTDVRAGTVEGKGIHFPLVDETKRVADETPTTIKDEKPLLLDPFEASDVLLLDYEVVSGKVVEKFSEEEHETKYRRAKKSIELYHLNEGTLLTQRAERGVAVGNMAKRIEVLFGRKENGEQLTQAEEEELENLQNDVANYICYSAEYSMFFRSLLRQLGSRGWNDALLSVT
jgi:hypothetical protein